MNESPNLESLICSKNNKNENKKGGHVREWPGDEDDDVDG